jgi:hypothetical protein
VEKTVCPSQARQAAEKAQIEALKKIPHLSNLNEDTALSDKLQHLCHPGRSLI